MADMYPQLPSWLRQQKFPNVPFLDVLKGGRQPFNPGGAFGGAGQELPSAQRFNRLAPSEQAGYTNYLEQELGVYPDDVYGLMNKLRPKGTINFAPRWAA